MWLLVLMILVMPYEQNPYLWLASSVFGVMPDFTVIKLLGLLGFMWATAQFLQRRVEGGLFDSLQARTFLVFYAGVVFSGLLSGTGWLAVTRYLNLMLFLPFVLAAVRDHGELRRVIYALPLGMAIALPYGLKQWATYGTRFGLGVNESNYLAASLVLLVPLAFAIAIQQVTASRRALWTVAVVALVVMLLLTGSRGGFLGLLVAGTVFVYRRRGPGAAVVLVLALVLAALPTSLGERALGTVFEGRETPAGLEYSNQAHVALFWAALRMIADAPLTGVGPYNFKDISTQYSGLDYGLIAHNTYLELAAEVGLPALVLFSLVVFTTFRALRSVAALRGSPEQTELAGWADGLRAGLLGFLVAGAFISAQYEKFFWLTVFLSIVFQRLAWRLVAEEAATAQSPPPPAPELAWSQR
jgi:hypothetical protein